jgi:hypothetical protein
LDSEFSFASMIIMDIFTIAFNFNLVSNVSSSFHLQNIFFNMGGGSDASAEQPATIVYNLM